MDAGTGLYGRPASSCVVALLLGRTCAGSTPDAPTLKKPTRFANRLFKWVQGQDCMVVLRPPVSSLCSSVEPVQVQLLMHRH